MRRLLAVLAVLGCHHDAANRPVISGHPSETPPEVRFALATPRAVDIVRTTDKGLVVERSTPVPDRVSRILWVGPDPAVWLDLTRGEMGEGFPPFTGDEEDKPGPHRNELGFVRASGYKQFPPLSWPPATRPTDEIDSDSQEVTEPNAALVVGKDGGLWEKRCRWYGGPDGGWCTYEYGRRYPEPVTFSVKLDERSTVHPFAYVAPSGEVTIEHLKRLREPDNTSMDEFENNQEVVSCKERGGPSIVYPPAKELDHNVDAQVVWISSDPPIFRTTEETPDYSGFGRGPPPEERIWEGCKVSARYDAAIAGPDDVVVLIGREVSVLWRGHEIGHRVDGATAVQFAPVPR